MQQNLSQSSRPTRVVTQELPIGSIRLPIGLREGGFRSPIEFRQNPAAGGELHSPISFVAPTTLQDDEETLQYASPWTQIGRLEDSAGLPSAQVLDPNQACLLRYFVDNISQWVCWMNVKSSELY